MQSGRARNQITVWQCEHRGQQSGGFHLHEGLGIPAEVLIGESVAGGLFWALFQCYNAVLLLVH